MTLGFCPRGCRKAGSCTPFRIGMRTPLVHFPRCRVGGRAGPGTPRSPKPAVLPSAPHTGRSRETPPTPGIKGGLRHPTSNILATHPKPPPSALTHSLGPRGDPATRTARGAAPHPAPSHSQAEEPSSSLPAAPPPRALRSRGRRGSSRPPGSGPAALPEKRWLGGEVRAPFGSAIFPWSGEPRAGPCAPAPAPLPPLGSIRTRCSTGPPPPAPAPHALPRSARGRTRHAHWARTCEGRTGSHAANARRAHGPSAHRFSRSRSAPRARATWAPVLTAHAPTACTCVARTARWHTGGAHHPCNTVNTPLPAMHTQSGIQFLTPRVNKARTHHVCTLLCSRIVHTRLPRAHTH